MDWAEWAAWLTYGSFKKKGLLSNQVVFEFDKTRIRHELQTNLYRFRYCPYMNLKLIEAVVDALPSEVTPSTKGPWAYKRDYNETPGAIKIKVREEQNGYAYTEEYYSSGVSPKSLSLGIDILREAALNKSFFNTLPSLKTISKSKADIAWFIYDLELVQEKDNEPERYSLKKVDEVYTEFEPALLSITQPSPGRIDDFIKLLQEKLDDQIETPPVNNTIEKPF